MVGKRAEILHLVESAKPGVIIGTETWLNSSISNGEILPDYYQVMRKYRQEKKGEVS